MIYEPIMGLGKGNQPDTKGWFPALTKSEFETMSSLDIQPKDPSRAHFWISMVKSGIRVIGFVMLGMQRFWSAALLLILAEVLGILEELF